MLHGLSFREYLDITGTAQLPVLSLEEILNNHMQLASSITAKIKVLPNYEKYIRVGYYPFFLETGSEGSYFERLQQVVSTVIENDIPAVEKIEYETLQKAKQGDLQVDGRHIFEVGGMGKGFAQIADLHDSYVVADGIEIGFGNKIPLWLFGFVY